MNSQNEIASQVERIQQAADGRPEAGEAVNGNVRRPAAVPVARAGTPAAPALPAFETLPAPDPLPLAEVVTMVPRAREKLKAGADAPGILRPMFRNQGGFNGIVLETCNRLVEVSQQLRQENNLLRARLDTITDYLARQNGWLGALVHGCDADRRAIHQLPDDSRQLGELADQIARLDRTEVRIDRLENHGDQHAEILARLDAQSEHRDTWLQNLQAHADEQEAREIEWREQITRSVRDGHDQLEARLSEAGRDLHTEHAVEQTRRLDETLERIEQHDAQLRELGRQSAEYSEHFSTTDLRLDEMGVHLNKIQEQVHGQNGRIDHLRDVVNSHGSRIDQTDERVAAVQAQSETHNGYLGGLQAHADTLSAHLNKLQAQSDGQREHLDGLQAQSDSQHDRLESLRAQNDGQQEHLGALQTHASYADERFQSLQAQSDSQDGQLKGLQAQHDGQQEHLGALQTHASYTDERFQSLQAQSDSQDGQLKGLQAQHDGQQEHLGALQTHASYTDERFQSLQAQSDSQDGQLKSLQAQNDGQQEHLGALQTHASYTDERFQSLQAQSDSRHEHVQGVREQVEAVRSHLGCVEEEGVRSRDQLKSLQAQSEAHSGYLGGLQTHADTLSGHVNRLQAQSDSQNEHIQTVHGHMDRLGEFCGGVGETVRRASEHLGALQTHASYTDERFQSLQAQSDSRHEHVQGVREQVEAVRSHLGRVEEEGVRSRDQLKSLQAQSEAHSGYLGGLQTHADTLSGHVKSVQTHADRLGAHLGELQGHHDRQGGRFEHVERRLDEATALCERARTDLQMATSHQHMLEENSRRLDERQLNDASYLRAQLSFHQRLFSHWLAPMLHAPGDDRRTDDRPALESGSGGGDRGDTPSGQEITNVSDHALQSEAGVVARHKAASAFDEHQMDAYYLAFENVMRGTREDIKERLNFYLPHLLEAHVGGAGSPVLDLGCGRGEWLELLRENGFAASGVDLNGCMIDQCRGRGLDARLANALDYLDSLKDASCGAITAFHLIEHLPFRTLVQFLNECLRVLQPGGLAIFETPNPRNLLVGACFFYDDHTHQRPLPPDSTRFLVEHVGFAKTEIITLHPRAEKDLVRGDGTNPSLVARFNEVIYGPQDYAILARKAGAGGIS